MPKHIVLSLHKVSKAFPNMTRPALRRVSFDVEEGQIVGLSGNSGSGKTTLLRVVGGFEEVTEGILKLRGTLIADPRYSLAPEERGIGVVFQDYVLFPHLSVGQNILFGISHLTKKEQDLRLEELIELVQLKDVVHSLPHEISGGQMQRVALARSLAPRPSIILFDEPFNSLDELLKEQLIEATRQILKQNKIAALFVTHDREEAFHMTDRIVMLHEGSLLQDAKTREVYEDPVNHLVASFFGKVNVVEATRHESCYRSPLGDIPSDRISPRPQADKILLMLRPHHLALRPPDEDHAIFRVRKVSFVGTYQEIRLETDTHRLIVHVDPFASIQLHQHYGVSVEARRIPHFTTGKKINNF